MYMYGQDSWILALFSKFFACLWPSTLSQTTNTEKELESQYPAFLTSCMVHSPHISWKFKGLVLLKAIFLLALLNQNMIFMLNGQCQNCSDFI